MKTVLRKPDDKEAFSLIRLTVSDVIGALLIGLAFVAGCGGDGPPRYHLSGTVTHGGMPIPTGSVLFTPDTTQGNSGPAISIKIRDGRYDTAPEGAGHVGGPHRVTITALDGQASDEFSEGIPMFPDYELQIDLPKEKSTHDLEIPAEWQAKKRDPRAVMHHGP